MLFDSTLGGNHVLLRVLPLVLLILCQGRVELDLDFLYDAILEVNSLGHEDWCLFSLDTCGD